MDGKYDNALKSRTIENWRYMMGKLELKEVGEQIISEETLLELFATEKQISRYLDKGRFLGTNKQTVLNQASHQCEIVDLGNKQYQIRKIYKYPVPRNFDKMNSGMYQYLIPLILLKLIKANIYEDKNETFSFTIMKWYRMIEMINDNYSIMKRNINYTSEKLSIDKNIMYNFFDSTDDSLVYYFKKSLQYLKEANLFNYQEINYICIREEENRIEDGVVKLEIKNVYRRATIDEMRLVRKCEQDASRDSGITYDDIKREYIAKERFFSNKSQKYLRMYNENLKEHNIIFCCKEYEIYSTDMDIQRCYKLLNTFQVENEQEPDLLFEVNTMFQNNILVNAKDRITKNDNRRKVLSEQETEKFLKEYNTLIMLTMSKGAKSISVPETISKNDKCFIDEFVNKNLNITLNNSNIKIGVDSIGV